MALRKKKSADGDTAATSTENTAKPKKQRWYHNIRDAYRMTKRVYPRIGWILIGIFVGIMAVALGVGFLIGHPIYLGFIGFLLAFIAVMIVLTRKTRTAAFSQIDGKPGAVGAVIGQIKRGWNYEQEPTAVNPRTYDMVYRMIGKPGIVLVSEGPPQRVNRMLADEKRKVTRVAPNVPVHFIQYGPGEKQVPLIDLQKTLRKLPKKLNSAEVAEVSKRMRALGSNKLPVPKGIDPLRARPDRKAVRGR
ncbi:DUF4191 domain-containing protein [Bogoriella caseilytica]|uniref:Uncharacterized protein DUF4191 n=1 Tax=Bogoriella caseilytica TaxID=56055 RepID=A0A3N2B961_9MICO|nr:DUF4191 domain-containing protein [Bogoriella caseilytica]ROR71813.1 uncharacterized protein DUF4191 [Bogoriella caseilytica]